MVCCRARWPSESGVMTIHGSVGPNLGGIGPGAGPEKLENPVHASLARIAEEFAGISDGQLSSGETPLVSDINDIVRPATALTSCLSSNGIQMAGYWHSTEALHPGKD